MTTVQAFTIRAGDYGHELDFYVLDENGSPYDIPESATVTFECRLDGAEALFITDTDHVTIVDDPGGQLRYTVQSGDFAAGDEGSYWCRMLINNITTSEVPLTVLADQTAPA
jgi:hypothetical protein